MIMRELAVTGLGMTTGFAASLIGWQINLLAIHRGLQRGRNATFFVGMGAAVADLVYISVAMAGVLPLIYHERFGPYLKWLGAAMIFLVALRTLLKKSGPVEKKPKKKRNPARSFFLGFVVVMSNPFLVIVWLGVVSFLVTHFAAVRIFQSKALLFLSFLLGAALWFLILSRAVLRGAKKWGEHRLQFLSRVSAIGLIAVGIFIIYHKF